MSLLATFLQISDLHIGDIDSVSGNARLSPAMVRMASNFTRFEGLMGHHARGLDDLAAFCRKIRPSQGEFRVIVSGDLTQSGSASELGVALDYIHGQVDIKPPNRNMVGLQLQTSEVLSIPGNHDHWNGSWQPLGGRPSQYAKQAQNRSTPYVERIPLANGRVVEFVGIDSDRNVGPFSLSRFLALGKFQSELDDQTLQLPANTNNHIRMFLVHHSWSASGNILRMTRASKSALTAYLVANDFMGLLTGHMHLFKIPSTTAPNEHPFEEFRCGSSTQHDVVPYNWRTLGGSFPKRKWHQNTVLVHRVFGDTGLTRWETETYGRFSRGGFQSLGAQNGFGCTV